MASINYYKADILFLPKNRNKLREWLVTVALMEKQKIVDVNYIFCSDSFLHEMNCKFLNHDDLTDVITFENTVEKGQIIGEIYISYDRIKENAEHFNVLISSELHRIMVHGLLHLLGFKDKSSLSKNEMTAKEDFYLNLRSEFNL